jgi:predicted DNA-binding transcriptional regulator YafY
VDEARDTAEKVRLLVQPVPDPDAEIAETVWRAVRDDETLRIRYTDVGGLESEREIEPQHVVVGPNGSYLTAWCHLRRGDRVFRLDRISGAERVPSPPHPVRAAREPVVDGHETRVPATVLRPEERLGSTNPRRTSPTNTDTGLSRAPARVETARRSGGSTRLHKETS